MYYKSLITILHPGVVGQITIQFNRLRRRAKFA